MVVLTFRDLADPIGKGKRLSKVFHAEVSLEMVTVDQLPFTGYLPSQAFHPGRVEPDVALPARNALPPGEVFTTY
jgi:hypothetical protein